MSLSVKIKKKAGDFLLDINLNLEEGVTGILGASGCGKSMMLKCIAGILKPDKGRIVLNGRVLFDSEQGINLKPQQRKVGYLFQNYALFPNMTVEQNILCGLCGEADRKLRREKAEALMNMMNLLGCRSQYPHQLSGGQQQRCALARILISEPELVLLDEPFSALDFYLREQLQSQVREILKAFGKDALLVSHSRDEIYYFCEHTAIMDRGNCFNYGKTKEVFADPKSRTAAVLTGCKNIAAAYRTGPQEVFVPEWGIGLKTGRPVEASLCAVGLRAHDFHEDARENRHPVVCCEEREELFELRVRFRYMAQKEDGLPIWWRMPKDRRPKQMPKELGIDPEKVLLLYPEAIIGD